jgi:CIC family chloride channel protein
METGAASETGKTPDTRHIGPFGNLLLAIAVGIVAGFGAAAFRWMIGFFHNLFFLGKLNFLYDANVQTPVSPWGPLVILAPVIGAFGVAFLVQHFAPEARGHGVPEVMEATYYNKGVIRPVVAVIKAVASALSIGTGGSVGREGPIVQIGSAFGSAVGQILRMPTWQRVTLIAEGAGGGIAATFNTPIGGILFAVEIIMHEVSVRTLVPVAISTATATYVGRILLGAYPSFVIPALQTRYFHFTDPEVLLLYVGLGPLVGLAAALFIKSIYSFEDFFDKHIRGGYYVRHVLGMLLVGIVFYALMAVYGHYYVEGVGYATVQDILTDSLPVIPMLLVLFVAKLVVTSLTLGSGGSGGIFSPSLFLGATLGGSYGLLLARIVPGLPVSPSAFAVAGMAGMVGGATGAAITAVVMIFEMTLDYSVIVPMTITVALSYGVRKMLMKESIYTEKIARRGLYIPEALQANVHQILLAKDLKDKSLTVVAASTPLADFVKMPPNPPGSSPRCFVVESGGKVVGIAMPEAALCALSEGRTDATLDAIADRAFSIVGENTSLFEIVDRLRTDRVHFFLVAPDPVAAAATDVTGWISKERISESIAEAAGLFTA